MDEVDVEDADDLNELEARLYAQIHHEASDSCDVSSTYKEASPVRLVTQTSVINNKSIDRTSSARYWNNRASLKFESVEVTQSVEEQRDTANVNGEINDDAPAGTVDKSVQPLVKNLSKSRVNPSASGNGPKAKGSLLQKQQHPHPRVGKQYPNPLSQKPQHQNKGPFARQLTKLSHAVKYEAKKQKAKIARSKAALRKSTVVQQMDESIDLISSNGSEESEVDDVIEVPLPSPTILTIDSSSDGEDAVAIDKNEFAMPHSSGNKENTSSQCTSPCSVISDDFIGQNDRSRLQQENIIADDEDLVLLQEDMDSLSEKREQSMDLSSDVFIAPSPDRRTRKSTATDYRVTQNDFRALDVYESESDIQESVYSKGQKKNSIVVPLEYGSSSGDDVEEIDVTQKIKRLRKRRASSTNKESENLVDSTDSEAESHQDESGHNTSSIPHIQRGEAIENYITDVHTPNKSIVNSSDNEFLAILNNLAQGTPLASVSGQDERNDDDEDDHEQITARAIAEKVIEKATRTQGSKGAAVANEAIPSENIVELDKIFEQIDSMSGDKKKDDEIDSPLDSDESVELVTPVPVPVANTKKKETKFEGKKLPAINDDPVYNVVYCNGDTLFGGIGWNDEMLKFYNNSWNGERFSVKAICSQMKKEKSLWRIYTDDRFPKYRRHSNTKCLNCCEFGHTRAKCPNPKKVPVCYMCGERGHQEPRCPNTLCLRCGNKTRMFTKSCNACNYQNRLICPICKVRGHNLNFCPDKWRRYHSTTKANEYPNNMIEYKNSKFCCVCGCRGHWSEHCRNSLRFSEYPVFVSDVRSHQKSYNDIPVNTIRSGIGYNLMYQPREDVSFELAENKTQQHYYGRFLSAVGLGYLLTRKRRNSATKDQRMIKCKKPKVEKALKEYVVNPFAKAALDQPPAASKNSANPDSTATVTDNIIDLDSETGQTEPEETVACEETLEKSVTAQAEETESTFKTPNAAGVATLQASKDSDSVEIVDSDSNYSFSDHFEVAKQTQETPQTPVKETPTNSREMGSLPDFISISDVSYNFTDEHSAGISKTFVSVDTDDDENSNADYTPMPDIPCKAKIYLTTFHSKFLLSPEGNQFLIERAKAFNVKANLDWTSVGHVLVLFGQRVNQDKFHTDLLHKFRELSDKLNRKQLENSQKVPRRKDVLIRFLREHIGQLLTNLGNVNDLHIRLMQQESQHTKAGWKQAERTRRLLNMILIGQAGLRDGALHLDNLISHLRNLIDNFKEEFVSNDLRDDIDSNWKLIFSSHRHDKYEELIGTYNTMQTKNRLQSITIDSRLLGKKILDTSLTKNQKEKMGKAPSTNTTTSSTVELSTTPKLVPNPVSIKNQPHTPRPSSEKKRIRSNSINSSSSSTQSFPSPSPGNQKKQDTPTSPAVNKIQAVNVKWDTTCVNILTELDNSGKTKKRTPARDGKATSLVWSREAKKYIDECMQLVKSNPSLTEKLTRVEKKSQKGLLSYNDYRAIIRIHNSMKGKQRSSDAE